MERKNLNRGFKRLRVWNDAIDLYVITCKIVSKFPYELKKTGGNCIDCSQSISRNIAEGYSRKGIREYLNFLNYALGSCGEYYSCICSFFKAEQLDSETYEKLDCLHYKVENELIQLIKSLNKKLNRGDWDDTII